MSDAAPGTPHRYDVVIVGAGVAGALLAKNLAVAGKRVLILEAGDEIKPNINPYMKRFYEATSKVPESPYTPDIFAPKPRDSTTTIAKNTEGLSSDVGLVDPKTVSAGRPTVLSISLRAWQEYDKGNWGDKESEKCDWRSDLNYLDQRGNLPFASTYERIAGGTARHWMGISLRHLPNDFKMGETYKTFTDRHGKQSPWPNWPIQYEDLRPWYDQAEQEIGVSGDAAVQTAFENNFKGFGGNPRTHGYPMAAIPLSYSDQLLHDRLQHADPFKDADGRLVPLGVTPIPAARNSEPFNRRRACAGNSSCIPICPIQAKYDPTITLRDALNIKDKQGNGLVTIEYRSVAYNIRTETIGPESDNRAQVIEYYRYSKDIDEKKPPPTRTAHAKLYVLAANAIETPRLMLMSNARKGVAGSHDHPVGRHLMDHPFYIAAATADAPVFPYRGPLVTGGIEVLRDGEFRKQHASFRVDVSNSGWSLTPNGGVQTITEDLVTGHNVSGVNKTTKPLAGTDLIDALHRAVIPQVSLGFLVEQTPDPENRVSLSDKVDGLGLPRPRIQYDFSQYTKAGLAHAVALARKIYKDLKFDPYNDPLAEIDQDPTEDNCSFPFTDVDTQKCITIKYMGAGHIAGTCRMGDDPKQSVVDKDLRYWPLKNLYIVGSSVFPTLGTANPTLTIAALSIRLADHLVKVLKPPSPGASV